MRTPVASCYLRVLRVSPAALVARPPAAFSCRVLLGFLFSFPSSSSSAHAFSRLRVLRGDPAAGLVGDRDRLFAGARACSSTLDVAGAMIAFGRMRAGSRAVCVLDLCSVLAVFACTWSGDAMDSVCSGGRDTEAAAGGEAAAAAFLAKCAICVFFALASLARSVSLRNIPSRSLPAAASALAAAAFCNCSLIVFLSFLIVRADLLALCSRALFWRVSSLSD